MPMEGSCWVSALPQTPEQRARDAVRFVKVALIDGHLTNISISMILVELKRRGLLLTNGERE